MYIPIVVAMSANQNVVAALKGGPVALIAGLGAVVIGFLLIKPLSKIGSKKHDDTFSRLTGGEHKEWNNLQRFLPVTSPAMP